MLRSLFLAPAVCLAHSAAGAASLEALSPAGRYGLDAADCRANAIFVTVTEDSVTFPVFSCRGVSFDMAAKTGDIATFKGIAKACLAEGQSQASVRTFRLVKDGTSVQFFWEDGTRSGKLLRCPERKRR